MVELPALRNAGLTDDEARIIVAGVDRIAEKSQKNELRSRYYDGKARVKNLGIAVPPPLLTIETVVGWPSTVVDSLEERLDIDSFDVLDADAADLGIAEWWLANNGPNDSGVAILDSLIQGLSFLALSPGGPGEPSPLLTVESASTMTGVWNARARRLSEVVHVTWKDDRPVSVTLWTRTDVVELRYSDLGVWMIDRRPHGQEWAPVWALPNKPRKGRPWGTSEISRAVRSYTDSAVRTLLGMEVAREFYSSPQRWIMGADEQAFVDRNGDPIPAWESYLGRFLAIGAGDGDEQPKVGQFQASSPAPYAEQVKLLGQLTAAEGAIPVTYMGFHTDNPPGGDGIRATEARLIKRAERRQRSTGGMTGFAGMVQTMLQMREPGSPPLQVVTRWRDAATPTKAATADQITKYVASGVLPADSDVTRELMGLDPVTRRRLADEDRRRRGLALLGALDTQSRTLADPSADR